MMVKSVPQQWLAQTRFRGPRLMAAGDSLLNGVQSLTIDGRRAAVGPVAVVARGLGYKGFLVPNYRGRVLIYDVEGVFRIRSSRRRRVTLAKAVAHIVGRLDEIVDSVNANTRLWVDEALGRRPVTPAIKDGEPVLFHDALGLGGAVTGDLLKPYSDWRRVVEAFAGVVQRERAFWTWQATVDGQSLGLLDLHVALNAMYLINPGGLQDPLIDDLSIMDLVEAREPEILVLNMGANHGIFEFTANGDLQAGKDGLNDFAFTWFPVLAERLRILPPGVQHAVVTTFPRPSQVPNTMPEWDRDHGIYKRPGPDGYLDTYEIAVPMAKPGFDDQDKNTMRANDRFVDTITNEIRRQVQGIGQSRFAFLDLPERFERFDFKADRRREVVIEPAHADSGQRTTYNSFAFGSTPLLLSTRTGGLATLDNHHPSTVGYQIMGNEFLDVLQSRGVSARQQPLSDRGDPLLTDPPNGYLAIRNAWRRFGRILAPSERGGAMADIGANMRSAPDLEEDGDDEAFALEMERLLRSDRQPSEREKGAMLLSILYMVLLSPRPPRRGTGPTS